MPQRLLPGRVNATLRFHGIRAPGVLERYREKEIIVGQRAEVHRPYMWHGTSYYIYASHYYHRPAYYGWVYNPWARAVYYQWGWAGNPWYGYYGSCFAPAPFHPAADLWLTDYLLAENLKMAYDQQQNALKQVRSRVRKTLVLQRVNGVATVIWDPRRRSTAFCHVQAAPEGLHTDEGQSKFCFERPATERPRRAFSANHNSNLTVLWGPADEVRGIRRIAVALVYPLLRIRAQWDA